MPSDQRVPFATYLLPSLSLPFRRRQQSTSSTLSDDSAPSLSFSPTASVSTTPSTSPPTPYFITGFPTSAKGLLHEALQAQVKAEAIPEERLTRTQPNTLKCITCASDIAFASQIVSKGFTGRHGRAYLVAPPPRPSFSIDKKETKPTDLINTKTGRNVSRELLTGAHVVADVTCTICQTVLGWKYVDAKELGQRYKIGKFILETKRVVMGVSWEDGLVEEPGQNENVLEEEGEDVVVFNSEDEDECEDLFAGSWDPEVVAKRRGRRVRRRIGNSGA